MLIGADGEATLARWPAQGERGPKAPLGSPVRRMGAVHVGIRVREHVRELKDKYKVAKASGTEAKGYYNAGYGRTYYYGPTRYYFYYGGVRHYHGTRTWGQCNGHCNQDVYIDQVSFKIYYASGTQADTMLASTAKTALSQVWPSIDPTLVTTAASSVGGPHVQFTALLPDGTGTDRKSVV